MTELKSITLPTKILATAPINELIDYQLALQQQGKPKPTIAKDSYLRAIARNKNKELSKSRRRLERLLAK
jgi:hypothetical protein